MRILVLVSLLVLPVLVGASQWQPTDLRPSFSSRQCTMCQFSVALVNYALKTRQAADQVYRITDTYCQVTHMESPLVCSGITKLFNREIMKMLINGVMTPSQVCGFLSNNTCGHYQDPLGDWSINLEASISLDQQELTRVRDIEKFKSRPIKPYRVIHISDTHVDPDYKEGSNSKCGEPLCCRTTSTKLPNESPKPAGYWGSYGQCDIPIRTLESALKFINQTIESDSVNYIIWTGDIQPHNVWEQNVRNASDTIDSVFSKIFQYLPNIKIFPTIGNHEMVPVDSFSPSNLLGVARDDSPEWLYQKLYAYWSRWLPSSTLYTITKDGFYAVRAQPGLKIISLNTNFCHNTNFWLYINSTDPGNHLQWLVHELQLSELEHEQVHIIGHIPPGSGDCLRVWSRNYNRIVRRFSNTVTGQFFGHTHNNEFEVFYNEDEVKGYQRKGSRRRMMVLQDLARETSWQPLSVGFIGPSITSFVGLNPSFRSYLIDPNQNFMPVDFNTFYMNLTRANLAGSEQDPTWTPLGSFSKLFNINDTSPRSIHDLLVDIVDEFLALENANSVRSEDLTSQENYVDVSNPGNKYSPNEDGKLFKLYKLFNSQSDDATREKFNQMDESKKREFLCRFFTSQSQNLSACKRFINHSLITSISQL